MSDGDRSGRERARQRGAEPAVGTGVVIGVLGPTGVGKTAVAQALAERLTEEWPRPPASGAVGGGRGPAAAAVPGPGPTAAPKLGAAAAPGLSAATPGTSGAALGRIVSCDSMQVYRGFPVLTNQPAGEWEEGISEAGVAAGGESVGDAGKAADAGTLTHAETPAPVGDVAQAGPVVHVAVGFVDPDQEFSVAQYASYVRPLIEHDLSALGWALVVGGTGLYMRAALAPLDVAAGGDPELRADLEARASSEGVSVLCEELALLDPDAAAAIDSRNSRRVIRALEAITLTGRQWSGRADLWAPAYYHPTLLVGLVAEREELYRRIDRRAARILQQGAVDEVRRFRETRRPDATRPGGPGIRSAIGYLEVCRFLDGEQTFEDTVARLAAATRRYARRQLTWLRKLEDAVIIDVQDREPPEVAQDILALARSGDRTRGAHRS